MMTAEETMENVELLLQEHGQGHLLAFWDRLDAEQRRNLMAAVQGLDLARIDEAILPLRRSTALSPPRSSRANTPRQSN